jgi:hypothetical protein
MRPTFRRLLRNSTLLLTSTWLGLGCAGYRITPGGTGSGYDVYRPVPYLLVTHSLVAEKDGAQTLERSAEILWLPDFSDRYRVKTWNHFGKADFHFEFEDGWRLVSIADRSDNTEPMKTLISAAQELAAQAATSRGPRPAGSPPAFQLYKVVFDANGALLGLAEVDAGRTLAEHRLPPPPRGFEWPGLLGALGWLLGFGHDSY